MVYSVCHMLGQLENNTECIVFCEFHDDMAEFKPDCAAGTYERA